MSGLVSPLQPATLVEILRHRASQQPDQTAYRFLADGDTEAGALTYQTLDQQARAIAAELQAVCNSGDRALLFYPPGLDYVAACCGCLYAGVVAVPAYPPRFDRPSDRVQILLKDAQATVVLTTAALLPKLRSLCAAGFPSLAWLATDALAGDRAIVWQAPPLQPDSLAFLQYTSGSTAQPKGVMLSHRNLLHNLSAIQQQFGHSADSVGVIWLPPYHDMGLIGGILQPLYAGFPVVLMPPLAFMQRPLRWLQAIARYRATTSGAPNFAYDLCVRKLKPDQLSSLDLSTWQVAFNGAEPVQAATLERFAAAFAPCGFRAAVFYPCYGLAEATLLVAGGAQAEPPIVQHISPQALQHNRVAIAPETAGQAIVGCGHSLPDQKICIVNPETCVPCAADEVGEVWVSGASVAQGYWQQPQATAETFRARLAGHPAAAFLRTGDLGFLHAGELFITGRLKELIIIRGRNHYPQDIERTAQASHAALPSGAGAAFAIATPTGEQLVLLHEVDRRAIAALDAEAVMAAVRQAIAEQHDLQVEAIALLKPGSLPKTSSGKLQRYRCRADYLAGALDSLATWQAIAAWKDAPAPAPAPPLIAPEAVQTWLVENLAAYLKVPPEAIDVAEPFAHYGLDSSVAVSLTDELAAWLGVEQLEPTLFWEYPSIEALAAYLGQSE